MARNLIDRIKRFFSGRYRRILLYLFLLMLVLNALTVPTADDLGYTVSSGFLDILHREYIQYMTWTGRSVAHLMARSFLAMPKGIFNVLNSLCFCCLVWLMCRHAEGSRRPRNTILLLLTALMVFLFAPYFGQTCLWETGSCNYLWTTSIILAFLLPYRLELETQDSRRSGRNPFLFALFGIAAGWTNENTAGAMILLVLLYLLLFRCRRHRWSPWMLTGLAGAALGFVMMIIAPGNAVRAAGFTNQSGRVYTLVHDVTGAMNVIFGSSASMRCLFALLFALLALCWLRHRRLQQAALPLLYALAGMAAVAAIILTPVPVLYDRSMFGAAVLVIIGVDMSFCLLAEAEGASCRRAMAVLAGILLAFSAYDYGKAAVSAAYIRYQYRVRERYVAAQREKGNTNPVVPLYDSEFETSYDAVYGLNDITAYPLYWVNSTYAQLHGIDTVQSTSLEQWTRIYKNGDSQLMNIQDMQAYLDAASAHAGYVILMNSSTIDASKYEKQAEALSSLGIDIRSNSHFAAVVQGGKTLQVVYGSDGAELETDLGGHYVYVSSGTTGALSDILVDNVEYTNDNPGISFVVYDTEQGRAVDSATWDAENEMFCVRYKMD